MKYRVLDVVGDGAETEVETRTPEEAAHLVLGERLVRGTTGMNLLRAKVYFNSGDSLTLVKLYQPKA
jgi:hypothetical protein